MTSAGHKGSYYPFQFFSNQYYRINIKGIQVMQENSNTKQPKPGRVEAFRNLPGPILKTLTKDEVKAFMFEDEWPESLAEKLKDYAVQ